MPTLLQMAGEISPTLLQELDNLLCSKREGGATPYFATMALLNKFFRRHRQPEHGKSLRAGLAITALSKSSGATSLSCTSSCGPDDCGFLPCNYGLKWTLYVHPVHICVRMPQIHHAPALRRQYPHPGCGLTQGCINKAIRGADGARNNRRWP